jgi:hypothetical protein
MRTATTKRLAIDWWIHQRHNAKFRKALCFAFAEHCYNVIEKGLATNKQRGIWPSSWNTLVPAYGLASDANLKRKRAGENATQIFECIGLASLIDSSPPLLIPVGCEPWLTAAVCYLERKTEPTDAELFVDYCIQQLKRHRERQAPLLAKDRVLVAELLIDGDAIGELAAVRGIASQRASQIISDLKGYLEGCL